MAALDVFHEIGAPVARVSPGHGGTDRANLRKRIRVRRQKTDSGYTQGGGTVRPYHWGGVREVTFVAMLHQTLLVQVLLPTVRTHEGKAVWDIAATETEEKIISGILCIHCTICSGHNAPIWCIVRGQERSGVSQGVSGTALFN